MLQAIIQAVAAFNLVCTGTVRSGPVGLALPEAEGSAIETVFRIDLESRRWCSDDCATAEPIVEMAHGTLVLRDRHESGGSQAIRFVPELARFTDTRIDGDTATLRSGTCRPADFTGLPDAPPRP